MPLIRAPQRRLPPNASQEPSPEQIRRACARIRSRWDEAERRKRAGLAWAGTIELASVTLGVLDGCR